MENNDDSTSAKMFMRKLVKKAIDECDDMELLDLVYRILVFDKTEGRADQPCLFDLIKIIRLCNPKRQVHHYSSNNYSIHSAATLPHSKQ